MKSSRSNLVKKTRVISITGGKGGIGKTTISINLAVALAKMKKKVLLFDADLGLANVDVLLGLKPSKTIHDVISGKAKLNEITLTGPHGIKIIPSTSGIQKMSELKLNETMEVIQSFSQLTDDVDIMIVDMASGISNQVIDFTQASQDIVVVICNDPASLMDSYAVIKILHQKYARTRFGIVVNKAKSHYEGIQVFDKFQEAVTKFLNINLDYLGQIPHDDYVQFAARERVSVVERYAQSNVAIHFNKLTQTMMHWQNSNLLTGGIQFFFEKLVSCE